jgi:hypothetical protein
VDAASLSENGVPITKQINAAEIAAWKFAAAPVGKGTREPANRVAWHFKVPPIAGGTVR